MQRSTSFDVAQTWYEALRVDTGLVEFCRDRFGELPRFRLGMNPRSKPGHQDCPYVMIVPVRDRDGWEADAGEHGVAVVLGFADDERVTDAEDALRYRGFETAMEFEALVRLRLDATNYPMSAWEGETVVPGNGQFERIMQVTVTVPRTLGTGF